MIDRNARATSIKFPFTCESTGELVTDFKEYYSTDHWRGFRRRLKRKKICFCCNDKGKDEPLHLHHKTYKNIGNEKCSEVEWLCEGCHSHVHEILLKNDKNKKTKCIRSIDAIRLTMSWVKQSINLKTKKRKEDIKSGDRDMSINKKYFFMKIKSDYFYNNKIKYIRTLEFGDTYIIILLQLCLLSLDNNGVLMYDENNPYTKDRLSSTIDIKVDVLEGALKVFTTENLIEILDTGEIIINDIQELIGKSSTEGDRQKKYRTRVKQLKKVDAEDQQKLIKMLRDETL